MTAYRMLKDSKVEPAAKAGTIVYRCTQYDYGCANDDFRMTGIPHQSMTFDPDGDYPFFTVPITDLEQLSTEDGRPAQQALPTDK